MSTITPVAGTTTPSSLVGILNDNFDALNDDKIEADSADTLENKTNDFDDNTVSNIETDNFKSSAKLDLIQRW